MYLIYTLPSSAVSSVYHEINAFFNDKVELLVPLKNKKHVLDDKVKIVDEIHPYVVTIIEHDHLRRCRDQLLNIMDRCIFIVDEVHKTLNDTQRTSIALEMSHLCHDFIVLTGTPVIDNKTYKLIAWLEQIVPFTVNEKNFWVAANGMIAKKLDTGITVDFQEIIATFTEKENKNISRMFHNIWVVIIYIQLNKISK